MHDQQNRSRSLVADDQGDIHEALRLLLTDAGYAVTSALSVDAAVDTLGRVACDLALVDMNYSRDTTSGQEGLDLIARARAKDPHLPIVAMTAWGAVEIAVEAMRRGARSFVQKPWEDEGLLEIVRREIEESQAARRHDERRAREQQEARLIQRGLLPAAFPSVDGCLVSGLWTPAAGVGGDCYDALLLSNDRIALSIADVSGKGLPAALLMAHLQAVVRAYAMQDAAPHDLCRSVNRIMCGNVPVGRFVTFAYCVLDLPGRRLRFVNAGHNPPAIVRADGVVDRLLPGGPVLGVFPDADYESGEIPLAPGDRLVLFTDGVTEAMNDAGDDFGDERLIALAREMRGATLAEMQTRIVDAARAFAGGAFQDDATLIVAAID
jgi:sigma-B regulation protein RsbU (phosphoserine phosphatase)